MHSCWPLWLLPFPSPLVARKKKWLLLQLPHRPPLHLQWPLPLQPLPLLLTTLQALPLVPQPLPRLPLLAQLATWLPKLLTHPRKPLAKPLTPPKMPLAKPLTLPKTLPEKLLTR